MLKGFLFLLLTKSPTRLEGMETLISQDGKTEHALSPTRLEGMETKMVTLSLQQLCRSPTRLEGMETNYRSEEWEGSFLVSDPP